MSTKAKMARFKKQMKALTAHKLELQKPEEQRDATKVMRPRDLIRIRNRCALTGRPRAVCVQ